jgi:hypothetical protein
MNWWDQQVPNWLVWLMIIGLGWTLGGLVAACLVGWWIKRGRYPPPH